MTAPGMEAVLFELGRMAGLSVEPEVGRCQTVVAHVDGPVLVLGGVTMRCDVLARYRIDRRKKEPIWSCSAHLVRVLAAMPQYAPVTVTHLRPAVGGDLP